MIDKFRDFALLRFSCPEGHSLGRAHMNHQGEWVLEAGSAVVWAGDKLRAKCTKCASKGKALGSSPSAWCTN